MRIISLEEHMATREVLDAWQRDSTLMRDMTMRWSLQPDTAAALVDLDGGRLAAMDEAGIDVAVLSLTTPGLQAFSPADAVALQGPVNDAIAAAVARHPDRFQGFAALATPDPAAAVRELHRTVGELGLNGVMLHTRSGDEFVDHPRYLGIFEAAAEHRVPVYLHPSLTLDAVADAYYRGFTAPVDGMLSTGGLGWHYQTGLVLLRLILAGTLDRFPDLQIILGHWGEMVLFYLDRISVLDHFAGLDRPLIDYFHRNVLVTPSGIDSHRYLEWSVDLLGPDRILQATDYPYSRATGGAAATFIENARLSESARAAIASENWRRLVMAIRRT